MDGWMDGGMDDMCFQVNMTNRCSRYTEWGGGEKKIMCHALSTGLKSPSLCVCSCGVCVWQRRGGCLTASADALTELPRASRERPRERERERSTKACLPAWCQLPVSAMCWGRAMRRGMEVTYFKTQNTCQQTETALASLWAFTLGFI